MSASQPQHGIDIAGHPDRGTAPQHTNSQRVYQVVIANNSVQACTLRHVELSFPHGQRFDHISIDTPALPLGIAAGGSTHINLTYDTPNQSEVINARLLLLFEDDTSITKTLCFCTETDSVAALRENVQQYTPSRNRFRYSEFSPNSEGERPPGCK
jgi:hypothetical protein